MKKVLSLVLVLSLTMLLAACGGQAADGGADPSTPPAGDAAPTAQVEEPASEATGESKPKVAIVFETAIADGGWAASNYEAMMAAAEELGFETAYTENIALADFVSVYRDYANMGYDLILCPGGQYQDAMLEVGQDYPDVNFLLIDTALDEYPDNISSTSFDYVQLGFLRGVIAGAQTVTKSVGAVNGMENANDVVVTNYEEIGAKFVDPDIAFTYAYVGNFTDVAKGKEIAASMISTQNVDVIINYAGAPDFGAREACREAGVWAIAQPDDIQDTDPDVILTSVVSSFTHLIKIAMQEVMDGTYGGKEIVGNAENGAISIGRIGDMVEKEDQDYILDIYEQVKSGEIDLAALAA